MLTIGPIGVEASKAIAIAEMKAANEGHNISVAHYDMLFLKPIDEHLLHEVAKRYEHIITVEDGVINGGMGSAVLEFLSDHGYDTKVKRIGMPDSFVTHGTVSQLRKLCGMDAESIADAILKADSLNTLC